MWNIEKGIKNIIGGKKAKDTDMDGVPDKKDCEPKNPMKTKQEKVVYYPPM